MCRKHPKSPFPHLPTFRSNVEAIQWFEQHGQLRQTHFAPTSAEDYYYYEFLPHEKNLADHPLTLEISQYGHVQLLRLQTTTEPRM